MELLDRYLQAIEFWLPKRQKQDIIAELSEDLRSQIEEKEAELGRKPGDGEVEAILKRCGPPFAVASRYQPQRYLIGPALFPVYRFVLAAVLLACVVPRVLLWLGFLIADPGYRGLFDMENLWTTVLYFAFFTTLGFAIAERSGVNFGNLGSWNPRSLPPVRDQNRIPISSSLIEIAVGAVFPVWFAAKLWPRDVIDLYGARLALAPVWRALFWGFMIVGLINLALAGTNLLRPHWTWQRASVRLLSDLAGGALFCWLFRAQPLLAISAHGLPPGKAIELTAALRWWMGKAFRYTVLMAALILILNAFRVIRLRKQPARPVLGVQPGV